MELVKFAAFRGMQKYQKIECAKVEAMSLSEEELQRETETAGLLAEDIHEESKEDMSKESVVQRQTFAWKPSPLRANDKIELLIHKLDNTSFTLEVAKKATVLDLKKTLQQKFEKSGYQISWPLVWGNFCLAFKNQKLLDNSVPLRIFGICDYDELYFVRHISTCPQPRIRGFFKIVRRNPS